MSWTTTFHTDSPLAGKVSRQPWVMPANSGEFAERHRLRAGASNPVDLPNQRVLVACQNITSRGVFGKQLGSSAASPASTGVGKFHPCPVCSTDCPVNH
jgi:hypothetical protein